MAIYLLDDSLKIEIAYEESDSGYADNIRVQIIEECPEDEKIFLHDETNIYLTPEQANDLARLLDEAAQASRMDL